MADDDAAVVLLLRPPPLQPPPPPLLLLLLACCCWPAVAGLLLLAYCCWPAAAAGVLLLTCCCWPATDAPLLLQAPSHRYRQCPEAAGRRGGRAAATFAVGVLHDVETRRAGRGGRARRRRRPRPQPLQLLLPKKLSLSSCTTALTWRQHASNGELPALLKSQARTEERRADVARGVSSRSAEERRRFASDSTISRQSAICML